MGGWSEGGEGGGGVRRGKGSGGGRREKENGREVGQTRGLLILTIRSGIGWFAISEGLWPHSVKDR